MIYPYGFVVQSNRPNLPISFKVDLVAVGQYAVAGGGKMMHLALFN